MDTKNTIRPSVSNTEDDMLNLKQTSTINEKEKKNKKRRKKKARSLPRVPRSRGAKPSRPPSHVAPSHVWSPGSAPPPSEGTNTA